MAPRQPWEEDSFPASSQWVFHDRSDPLVGYSAITARVVGGEGGGETRGDGKVGRKGGKKERKEERKKETGEWTKVMHIWEGRKERDKKK